jgi:drug/metabolite transporter (DMT)-like permease
VYGLLAALGSAVLFGAAIPAARILLAELTAFQLAGLLYVGAAIGIGPWVLWWRHDRPPLDEANRRRLVGAVVLGGIVGPVLLLLGLRSASAGSVSLLLNSEVAATALLAALVFREAVGMRSWLGIGAVIIAGTILSRAGGWPGMVSAALVVTACVCWGLDNNFTALIDGMSPSETTLWKTAIAGMTNLLIGITLAPIRASVLTIAVALVVGALSYGVSIALYIRAAHTEGASRAQAVFATAPFIGAAISWSVLREPIEAAQVLAGVLFAGAVVLLAFDAHSHSHAHEALSHIHGHRHDDGHHEHVHPGLAASNRHSHWHEHPASEHTHPHVADLHHRHGRGS